MKDKLRFFGTIVLLLSPGTFFILFPKINSNLGLSVFLFLVFTSGIETFRTIKYFHEK